MARVKISEYAAKRLFTNSAYKGVSVDSETDFKKLNLDAESYVVKVDDGTKKRNKKGLVVLSMTSKDSLIKAQVFLDNGHSRVLLEPTVLHDKDDERYISFGLVRDGVEVIYSKSGGNDVEDDSDNVSKALISRQDFLNNTNLSLGFVSDSILNRALTFMKENHASFVEINPFIITEDEKITCLDLAVEVDSSKLHKLPAWIVPHVQESHKLSEVENNVRTLDSESTATFSLTVFDKDAQVFTLLSGGGASLVVLDELVDNSCQAAVANYGEYSGAPSREETYRYTKELLKLLFASRAKKKVLMIAGGVANFTDVTTTFEGVIDACAECTDRFRKQSVLVQVRRGGPRQSVGLAMLDEFFSVNNIKATISGPETTLSEAVSGVTKFLK